jgi:hypothetical protein
MQLRVKDLPNPAGTPAGRDDFQSCIKPGNPSFDVSRMTTHFDRSLAGAVFLMLHGLQRISLSEGADGSSTLQRLPYTQRLHVCGLAVL